MAGPRPSFALAFVAYSALRLLVFVVPLLVIYGLSRNPIVSAVLAAVIGLALSMILLDRQRGSVAKLLLQRAETRQVVSDEAAEDEVVDEARADRAEGQNDSAAANPRP
jgi:TctA family transporter